MRGLGAWAGAIAMLVGCGRGDPALVHTEAKEVPPPSGSTGTAEPTASTGTAEPAASTGTADPEATEGTPTGSPSEPAPAQPGADGKTFTVDARLVDRGKRTTHCGVLHVVGVMKIEVVKVLDGRYDGDTLYVYVSCPEMWMVGDPHGFEVGTVYRWTLDTRIERRTAGAKLDAFPEVKAPRYRLEKLELPVLPLLPP